MLEKPKGTFQTPFGQMDFTILCSQEASVSGTITVNRVEYRVHAHLHRQPDGSWWVEKPEKAQRWPSYIGPDFYVKRPGNYQEGTPAAREKAARVISAQFSAAVTPELLRQGDIADAKNEIAIAEENVDLVIRELEDKRRILREAERRLAELG